jgi:hypothetical protein
MVLIVALLSCLAGPAQEDYIQQEERKIQKAKKVLESNPTDPEASLAVGKFLCFVKGSWDDGLAYLAVCRDQNLVKLAMTDIGTQKPDDSKNGPLTGAVFDFGEEIAIELVKGDQWWTEARNHNGSVEKINIYNRASYWYRRAYKKVDDAHRKKLTARINAHSKAMGSIEIRVPMTPSWTDTGIEVIAGQLIRVTARGSWAYGPTIEKCGWTGYPKSLNSTYSPLKDANFLCLTAKVGENGPRWACYKDSAHPAESDGHLMMGPNHVFTEGVGEMFVTIDLTLPY